MSEELNYSSAYRELQEILHAIQKGDMELEKLTSQVKRAQSLLQLCREKLKNAELEMDSLLDQIDSEED